MKKLIDRNLNKMLKNKMKNPEKSQEKIWKTKWRIWSLHICRRKQNEEHDCGSSVSSPWINMTKLLLPRRQFMLIFRRIHHRIAIHHRGSRKLDELQWPLLALFHIWSLDFWVYSFLPSKVFDMQIYPFQIDYWLFNCTDQTFPDYTNESLNFWKFSIRLLTLQIANITS